MSYYFIAQIKINDDVEYLKYIKDAGDIFNKFKGEYLAVDDKPIILEGKWKYSRTVLIHFQYKEDFDNWYNSPDYQKILQHRLNSADCDSVLIRGMEK